MGLSGAGVPEQKNTITLDEYIGKMCYVIMRQLPNAPRVLGVSSFWELRTSQVTAIAEYLQEEFGKETKK